MACHYNPKFTKNCSCKLNFINRMQKSYTSKCFFTKPIDRIFAHTQLYHRFRSGYQIFLIDRLINICDYFHNNAGSKIIDIAFPTLTKYITSPLPFKCPYYGHFDVVGLPLTGPLMNNLFLPVGNYMLNLTVFHNETELIWNGKYYFIIPEGKTIEDDRMGR